MMPTSACYRQPNALRLTASGRKW